MKKIYNIVLIALAIAIAVFIYKNNNAEKQLLSIADNKLLLPELRNELNDIVKITLENHKYKTSLILDKDNKWVVKQKDNYPANMQQIRKLLLYFSQSEIRQIKTDNPKYFNRIGLDDLSGIKLKIFNKDKLLYNLVVGLGNDDANSTFVKFSERNQTYKASGELNFSVTPNEWLDFSFISLMPDNVQKITYNFSGKQPYQYSRQTPQQKMELSPSPTDNSIIVKNDMQDPASYFTNMAFTDVKSIDNLKPQNEDTTIIYTFNGIIIKFKFYEIDFMPWVEINAEFDKDIYDDFAEKDNFDIKTIKQQVQQINILTNGWLYQLGRFQQQNLSRSYLDLTEIKE